MSTYSKLWPCILLSFVLIFIGCMNPTDSESTLNESEDPVISQWSAAISGRILQFYYSDNYYIEKINIGFCPNGTGSYLKSSSAGQLSFDFQWRIENTPAGVPILYLEKGDDNPYSYNLVMQDGIIYLNRNKYLRLEEPATCN